jgi:hypothetical protein
MTGFHFLAPDGKDLGLGLGEVLREGEVKAAEAEGQEAPESGMDSFHGWDFVGVLGDTSRVVV